MDQVHEADITSFPSPRVLDCQKLAEIFTFVLDETALNGAATRAMGELVWMRRNEDTQCKNVAARPALVVHSSNGVHSADRTEIVPHVAAGDPLLQHVSMVLEARFQARSAAGYMYAESLADGLAAHFLRRYSASNHRVPALTGGLPSYKLKRVLSYVDDHLDEDLSLTRLGGIAETSVAHFSRLFKRATGSSPHHYVLACRIKRARKLLAETDVSICEIAQRVGLADQSHLTALFRTFTATTPRAYRVSAKW